MPGNFPAIVLARYQCSGGTLALIDVELAAGLSDWMAEECSQDQFRGPHTREEGQVLGQLPEKSHHRTRASRHGPSGP